MDTKVSIPRHIRIGYKSIHDPLEGREHPMHRFHVRLGGKRTTVTLDSPIPELLALSLKAEPHTPVATTAIQQWLQHELDADEDPGRVRVSQWPRGRAIFHLLDKSVSRRYKAWLDKQIG
jgi:hypothetical protein